MFLDGPVDNIPPASVLDPHGGINGTIDRSSTAARIHADQRATARGSGAHPCHQQLPSQQFQALFNSLFKVLFIFPSRYFFAIGLSPVFSLRWNLPPALSYNPKQLDSVTRPAMGNSERRTGLSPSLMPCSKGLTPGSPKGTHVTTPEGFTTWALPASVALTEGILVSFFSSA